MEAAKKTTMTRKEKAMNTKAMITEETARLFEERGYTGTTIREIVKRCGLTTGAFYQHFSSKEDVLIEILKSGLIDNYNTINRYIDRDYTVEDYIQAQVDVLSSLSESCGHQMMMVYYNALYNNDLSVYPDIKRTYDIEREVGLKLVRRLNNKLGYSDEEAYNVLAQTIRGVWIDWILAHGAYDIGEAVRSDLRAVIYGMYGDNVE